MAPKTLHLTNFYHERSGGIAAFYRALFACAESCGRDMRLIVPGEESGCEEIGRHGKLYTVRSPRSPWIDSRYRILLPVGRAGREIREILRHEKPDILEVSDKFSLPFLSGMVRVNWISGVGRPTEFATSHERLDHNVAVHATDGLIGQWFSRAYMRFIYYPQFDHHIANSEYTALELTFAKEGNAVQRGVWVCPMGVDTRLFSPCSTSLWRGKMLYAGRLAREKNIGLLVQVLERLGKGYSLTVMGDGPERSWFEELAERRAPGRVRLLGFITDRREYAQEMRDADVFLHPNPNEPFGIVPLEAMASGVPVVAPNSGGVLSYASPANAWLSEPSAEGFARTVREIAENAVDRQSRVTAALDGLHYERLRAAA